MIEIYKDRYWKITKPRLFTGQLRWNVYNLITFEFHKIHYALGDMNNPGRHRGWTLIIDNTDTLSECMGRQGAHIHIVPQPIDPIKSTWLLKHWMIAHVSSLPPSALDTIMVAMGYMTEEERDKIMGEFKAQC